MLAIRNAWNGIRHAWATQANFRIQVGIGIVVIGVMAGLGASWTILAVVVLTCVFVLALEVLNTALEALVDLASPGLHPLAKAAKDAAAGAVLIGALGALAVAALALRATLEAR